VSKYPQIPMCDRVRLFLPLDAHADRDVLFKAAVELPDSVPVRGLVSSELRDIQGERIIQSGMDWSWFLKFGRLTAGHPATNRNVIGQPVRLAPATLADGTAATFLEGSLWLRKPLGLETYRDHQAALAAGDPGMGFSIEGKATQRDPYDMKTVLACIIYTVAIAFQPINPATFIDPIHVAALAKALTNGGARLDEGHDIEALLYSFLGGLEPADNERLTLIKGVSNDDLRALRVLRKASDATLDEARAIVAARQGISA
jgi:hypothetical protein